MTVWSVTGTSCLDVQGNVRPSVLLNSSVGRPKLVVINGDGHYSNMGPEGLVRGVNWDPDVLWRPGMANPPTNARTLQRVLDRFELFNGEDGTPPWAEFHAIKEANNILVDYLLDDHDLLGDNWDFTLTALNGTFPDTFVGTNVIPGTEPFGQVLSLAGGTSANDDGMKNTDTLDVWRIRQQAKRILLPKYFSNPPSGAPNGDIPAAMVGVAVAADFDVDYYVRDFGPNGELGGSCIRHIFVDSVAYKARIADADITGKTFWGAVQTAWLKARLLEAKQRGFGKTFLWMTKDVFGGDNKDGMGYAYTAARTDLLTFIRDNDIDVTIMSGDKHNGHVSIARIDQGDIVDLLVYCVSPCGSRHSALDQHRQLVCGFNSSDLPNFCEILTDASARTCTVRMIDAYDTSHVLSEDVLAFGQRLPIRSYRSSRDPVRPRGNYGRTAVTVGTSPWTWQNLTGRAVSMVLTGGTLTNVEISQDDFTTTDSLGTAQRQVQLQAGESVRVTWSSGTLTAAYYPVLLADER